jgi:hypothetical protein
MKLFRVVLVCAFFLTAPAIAFGDLDRRLDPPDGIQQASMTLAEVLALNAKAEGKQLDTFATRVEVWTSRSGGTDEITTTAWSGKDFKTTFTWGPIVEQSGRIAGVRWRQNFNGMVVIEGGIHQRSERFDNTLKAAYAGSPGDAVKLLGEVATPFPAFIVQVQPAGDPPTWMFIDKSSGLETRAEGVSGAIRFTTTFRDFRTTDGATVPWIVESTDGRAEDDTTTTRTSLKLNVPVSPTDLNLPQTKRQLVEFPAGAASVLLPASMPDMSNSQHVLLDNDYTASRSQFKRHMVVRVSINGRGLDFLLDSGAGAIFLDKQVADDLGLTQYPLGSQIFGGPTDESYAIVPELRVGALTMKNIVVVASPPLGFRVADTEKIAGILGYDFIANVGLKVDWDKGQITAYPPGTMQMPATSVTLPIMLDDLIPYVPASIGDVASDHFLLDTGADDVYIFPAFAREHKAALADQGLGHRRQLDLGETYSIGASGVTEVIETQVKRFVFGVPFSEFIVQVQQSDAKYPNRDLDGLIGFHFLHYFNLYFDYPNSRIVLEPNDQFRNAKHIPAH